MLVRNAIDARFLSGHLGWLAVLAALFLAAPQARAGIDGAGRTARRASQASTHGHVNIIGRYVMLPRTLLHVAALIMALSGQAQAIVFDFSWTGNPGQDSTILSSDDATLSATGTIAIDALPGDTFTLTDIVATSISVTGVTIGDFVFSSWVNAGGSISADGLSAVFSAVGNPWAWNGDGGAVFLAANMLNAANPTAFRIDTRSGLATLVLTTDSCCTAPRPRHWLRCA